MKNIINFKDLGMGVGFTLRMQGYGDDYSEQAKEIWLAKAEKGAIRALEKEDVKVLFLDFPRERIHHLAAATALKYEDGREEVFIVYNAAAIVLSEKPIIGRFLQGVFKEAIAQHEIAHVQQMKEGKMNTFDGSIRWAGKEYKGAAANLMATLAYNLQPWEIDAEVRRRQVMGENKIIALGKTYAIGAAWTALTIPLSALGVAVAIAAVTVLVPVVSVYRLVNKAVSAFRLNKKVA